MKKRLFLVILVTLFILPPQVFANENNIFTDLELPAGKVDLSKLPIEFQKKLTERASEVKTYFETLHQLEMEVKLAEDKLFNQSDPGILTIDTLSNLNRVKEKLDYYKNNSKELSGLEKLNIEETSNLLPYSNSTQANVIAPTIYYDNDVDSYVLQSGWAWNAINPDNNNSSDDGFGLRINQEKISLLSDYLTVYDYYGNLYWPTYDTIPSEYGYYQTFNDAAISYNYQGHSGTSFMYFRFYNGKPYGKTVNFNGQYAHTWLNTSLSGISIGPTSFGGTFTTSTQGWKVNNYSYKTF